MDEHHISPIENLDNTINSLYSYLSGSEGEADMPRPHRLAPHRNPGGVYDRRRADPSPCASSSRSSYESEHDRSHDHAGSCNEGESHYSRINDADTLPSIPPIPPPPLEELTRPHVPPRTTYGATYGDRAGYGERSSRGHLDVENDFEPCFLMQTPSGSVFLPPACTSPQGGPPLPYPRPAAGFPGQPQPQWSPNDETAETSTGATDIDIATQTGLPSSGSVESVQGREVLGVTGRHVSGAASGAGGGRDNGTVTGGVGSCVLPAVTDLLNAVTDAVTGVTTRVGRFCRWKRRQLLEFIRIDRLLSG
ncbi:hypothetical protein NP493_731g01027 [Ridgeia piscesae]|uniref:Uncharacterized protein n=1 Tax=Ridgeia piscesae TaxID=27915 RepID=A0AAD9KQ18_RIDPI|nr:hypothetical protein NP493_731g01027 [Ridgeia piscesae]